MVMFRQPIVATSHKMVAAKTGIPPADAQKRVDDMVSQAKAAEAKVMAAADEARKAATQFLIFTAVSVLIGAFIACTAAALGGASARRASLSSDVTQLLEPR